MIKVKISDKADKEHEHSAERISIYERSRKRNQMHISEEKKEYSKSSKDAFVFLNEIFHSRKLRK